MGPYNGVFNGYFMAQYKVLGIGLSDKYSSSLLKVICLKFSFNPICAEIFSHPIGAGGGVIYDPPLISGHSGHRGTN